MQLCSSQTPWNESGKSLPDAGPLACDLQADVVIIGSGISGALIAYHLVREDSGSIVMLDRRDIAGGSIGASTALLQYEMDTRLIDLAERIGADDARRAYQLCVETLGHFDAIVNDIGGACGYTRRQSLYLSGNDGSPAELFNEYLARQAAGINVDFFDRNALREQYGIERDAAILSREAAEVNPLELTRRLLEDSVARGLRIFGRTGVKRYEPGSDGVTLLTDGGRTVRAKRVIFATGYETQDFLGQSFVTLSSTYAVTSEPVTSFGDWKDRCLIWEAATPYFYCRTTADNRILIGGEDEPTTDPVVRDAMLPAKTKTLIDKFHALFPDIPFTPSRTWAGVFAESDDSLPYIGQHPRFPNGYFSLGYGGNGITFALIAARIIRDDLCGRTNPDARLFAFDRKSSRAKTLV